MGMAALPGTTAPTSDAADEYLQLSFDKENRAFTLLINADKWTPLLELGSSVTLSDLRAALPAGLVEALRAHDIAGACDILGIDLSAIVSAEVLESIIEPELLYQYLTLDVLRKLMSDDEILSLVDTDALLARVDRVAGTEPF